MKYIGMFSPFVLLSCTLLSVSCSNKHFDLENLFKKAALSDETKDQYLLLLKKVKNNEVITVTNKTEELKTAVTLDLARLKKDSFIEKTKKRIALASSVGGRLTFALLSLVSIANIFEEEPDVVVGIIVPALLAIPSALCSYFTYEYSDMKRRVLLKKERKIEERKKIAEACEVS